jgi:hypothetical protein
MIFSIGMKRGVMNAMIMSRNMMGIIIFKKILLIIPRNEWCCVPMFFLDERSSIMVKSFLIGLFVIYSLFQIFLICQFF